MLSIDNSDFLRNLFTTKEFDFIDQMDSDMEFSSKMLYNEQKNRDLIVNLINNLNDAISYKHQNNESYDKEQEILQRAKTIFDIINDNISLLQANTEVTNSIKKGIIDLLVEIESDSQNVSQSKYMSEIADLKAKISVMNGGLSNVSARIEANNHAISSFLNNSYVQKFINDFSLNTNANPVNNEDEDKNNSQTTTYQSKHLREDSDVNVDYSSSQVVENNNILLVSEKNKKVYLPYSKEEVLEYLRQYPEQYSSFDDVVKKEFIFPSSNYLKHPVIARFREAYSLIRDREFKSVLDAFKFAMDVMFDYDLNPVIIAACKSQAQLERYLKCLDEKDLSKFTDFEIKFEISPLKK